MNIIPINKEVSILDTLNQMSESEIEAFLSKEEALYTAE